MTPYQKLEGDLLEDSKSLSTFNSLINYISYIIYSVDSYNYYVPPLDSEDLAYDFAVEVFMEIYNGELVLRVPGFSKYLKRRLKGYALSEYTKIRTDYDITDLYTIRTKNISNNFDLSNSTRVKEVTKKDINTVFADYCRYRINSSEYNYYTSICKSYLFSYYGISYDSEILYSDIKLDRYARFLIDIIIDKIDEEAYLNE